MWSQLTLVTDDDLGAIEPEAIADDSPWGQNSWPLAIAEAQKDLRLWVDLAFPTIPSASDRVLERWAFDKVLGSTILDGPYQDYSAQARDDNEDDLDLSTVFAAPGDTLLVGAKWEYDGVLFKLNDASARNSVGTGMTTQYWGANGWTTIAKTDGTVATAGVSLSQTGRVRWATTPADWEPARMNQGDEYLWVRFVLDAPPSAGTTLSQLVAIRPPLSLKRTALFLTLATIKTGLASGASDPEFWLREAERYRGQARTLFDQVKSVGLPLDVDRTQVISPQLEEQTIVAPLRLRRG